MKKIYIFASVLLTLTACDRNDINQGPASEAVRISASIGGSTASRAVDESWEKGDRIGISSTVGDVTGPYINLEYITETADGEFTGETDILFYKPMTLTAYYPFAGTEGTAPGQGGLIEASTSAEYQTGDKRPEIDFLWDSQTGFTASNLNVQFKFAHKMSKVTFAFEDSEEVDLGYTKVPGVDVSNMVSYSLKGLVLDGTFDTTTGICAAKEDATPDSLAISLDKGSVVSGEPIDPIILFPQTLSGGSIKLHIYTDELNNTAVLQHYICTLTFGDGVIKPGCHYNYTIKVTKLGLIVGNMTVGPWIPEPDRYIVATIDGDNIFNEE